MTSETLEMSGVSEIKGEETVHKHRALVNKVASFGSKVNHIYSHYIYAATE